MYVKRADVRLAFTNLTSRFDSRYYGDRWQSSPDGIKSHDFTYFFPLSFQADGNVTDMRVVDSFQIDI